jgi:biopolymer transport protein ExbD
MVSAQLKRPEADLDLALPGEVAVTTQVIMPDEQIIVVDAAGVIRLNNQMFSGTDANQLAQLKNILIRYKAASNQMGQPAAVMIDAHDDSIHERVIDVLNLCAAAKIEQISFGSAN